jgi:hypothetical protein
VATELVRSITTTSPSNLILAEVENIVIYAPLKPREF